MSRQLDLRLNSITVPTRDGEAKSIVKKLDGPAKVTVEDLDAHAKAIGRLIDVALRHGGLTQTEASRRMGYADASKLARWIAGDDVSSFLSRLLSLPELRTGFALALLESVGSGVTVRTVVEISRKASVA